MHYPDVLAEKGCTPQRLREIFTSGDTPSTTPEVMTDTQAVQARPKNNGDIRRRFESRIRSRILDGVGNNLRSARPNQAVDMAWDAPPISRETLPLMLWAQGKIKIEGEGGLMNQLCGTADHSRAQATNAGKWFAKDPQSGVIKINVPRITDVQIDLVKSYVTRRHAAMNALWSNLWPLFRYDPRGADDVSQCRADVLTQRVDIISDAYNYRHFFGQCRRFMLLYGYSIAFPRSAWDKQSSWRFEQTSTGEPGKKIESFTVREGVQFDNPHPSRIFADLSAPLADLNTDTGPGYIGYWDVVRYGSLLAPGAEFFNLDKVFVSNAWIALANQFGLFFNYYFDPKVMSWPETSQQDPTMLNDREARIGKYAANFPDMGVLLTRYMERINPKIEGIGDYDADVWIRLTVAGDCTIIGAEFMPSLPGAYGGVNWNDSRQANQSMAMALLAYQDQASNIVSHMLMQLRSSLVQLWLIDKDSLEPEIREEIKKNAQNSDWWVDPKFLMYSATKLRDLGILDPAQAFRIVQNNIPGIIENGLKALTQLLNLADRLLILSPNELGQPNPREVAAREVTEMATSVQSMNAFTNEGPREQVAAAKELIYESLVCCGTPALRVPVMKRYSQAVVKAAGFQVDSETPLPEDALIPIKTPVTGNLRDLVYDYYFDSRDGAERVLNTQGAQVVMQLLQSLIQIPGLAQKMGLNAIMEGANTVLRMSGAPWNFQFEVPVGGDDSVQPDQSQQDQVLKGVMAQLQRMEAVLMQALHLPPGTFGNPGGQAPNGGAPAGPGAPAAAAAQPSQQQTSAPAEAGAEPGTAELMQEPATVP